jgi:hypothetical protein
VVFSIANSRSVVGVKGVKKEIRFYTHVYKIENSGIFETKF